MGVSFQSGSGNKIFVYASILPLGVESPPVATSQVLTLDGAVLAAATSIDITSALTEMLPRGTMLVFNASTTKEKVFVNADVDAGETTIPIEPALVGIADASTATTYYKFRLMGGTQANFEGSSNVANSTVFEDSQGFESNVVTTQAWNIPWTANALYEDESMERIRYAWLSRKQVYIWLQEPAPAGYTTGTSTSGTAVIEGFTKEHASDGILTYNCTFRGNGTPIIAAPAA